jgi:hypothetical protein
MGKIPVLQTIAETYAFAFRRYLPILGVLWVPFLLICGLVYYYLFPALMRFLGSLGDIALHPAQDPKAATALMGVYRFLGQIFLFEFVVLVIVCVIAVGVTKEALGLRRGPRFVYLAFGKSELLVIGGMLTIFALYLGAIIAFAIVAGIAGAVAGVVMMGTSGAHGDPAALAASTLVVVRWVTLLFYLVFVYFVVRLTFFVVPVSTAEGRFGVWRSWALTKGNFWRTIGVILGTFLPITIVSYALWYFVFGPALFQPMWHPQANPAATAAQLGAQLHILARNAIFLGVYSLLLAPISYGLMFGQSVFAYRAVVGDKAVGPWGK